MATLIDLDQKPSSEEDFKKWFSFKFSFDEQKYHTYYEHSVSKLQNDFVNSEFWTQITGKIKDWDSEYYLMKAARLFPRLAPPNVVTKSLSSLINKAYRKNVLKNKNFPNKPNNDWITPENWLFQIHDIVRTTFVVKYLDGVQFLSEKMSKLAFDLGLSYTCTFEAREEGYYAAHASIIVNLPIIDLDWKESVHPFEIEIQITTELQEMIKSLLHKFYEDNRIKVLQEGYKWQWDYKSEQFTPNYLGHIAHYIEGMIVEIRDKQNK